MGCNTVMSIFMIYSLPVRAQRSTKHLREVLQCLCDHGIVIHPDNYVLRVAQLQFPGHHVDSTGICPLEVRLSDISLNQPHSASFVSFWDWLISIIITQLCPYLATIECSARGQNRTIQDITLECGGHSGFHEHQRCFGQCHSPFTSQVIPSLRLRLTSWLMPQIWLWERYSTVHGTWCPIAYF